MPGPTLSKNTADFELLLGGRYLLESVTPGTQPDGYLLEDGSGVLLLDTLTPSLGDPVVFTNPSWSGRVVSVAQDLIVDGAQRNYKRVSVTATNQTADPGGTAPGDFSDVPAGGYYLQEDGSGDYLLEAATNSYRPLVLVDLPRAYWRLDDSALVAADVTGSYAGAYSGGVSGLPGPISDGSGAKAFNGTTGQVIVPTAPGLHPGDLFSVEFWLKTTTVIACDLVGSGGTGDFVTGIGGTGQLFFNKTNVAVIMTSTAAYNDGLWHHIVWTKNAATNRLYADGVNVTPAVNNQTIVPSLNTIVIGNGGDGFFAGSLDDVALYGYDLTAAQVSAHYAAASSAHSADRLLLEGTSFVYRELSVRQSQNQDGTTTTYGSLVTFEGGFAAGQTFLLTNNDLGYAAQSFAITNVTTDFIGANPPTPRYRIEFGDAYQTLQQAGGGVLTRTASVATQQLGVVQPAGTLGYAQVTASQGSITTQVDLTGLAVTVTVGSGRRIKVTGQVLMGSTLTTGQGQLYIMEGATQLQVSTQDFPTAALNVAIIDVTVLTPTAGVHTYKLQAAATTGTSTMVASATAPAFLLVEDIGG